MNWHRLKNKQCPACKCDDPLTQSLITDKYECQRCGFHIRMDKFDSLVSSFYRKVKPMRDESEDNLSGLSNL